MNWDMEQCRTKPGGVRALYLFRYINMRSFCARHYLSLVSVFSQLSNPHLVAILHV